MSAIQFVGLFLFVTVISTIALIGRKMAILYSAIMRAIDDRPDR